MKLNIATGDMYKFVSHTGNIIKGKCQHDCSYCYMKKFPNAGNELRLVKSELVGNLGGDKFIFIGSSTDMFASNVKSEDIKAVLDYCNLFDNQYLFQSKNPSRFLEFIEHPVFSKSILCTTIETNRNYKEFMGNAPIVEERARAMEEISRLGIKTMVTIEPIMDFDLDELLKLVKRCNPIQVNIGKNTFRIVQLPEPDKEKAEQFVSELKKFTIVSIKDNLKRK